MFSNPMVIALKGGAVLTTVCVLFATGVGVRVLLFWNHSSSGEGRCGWNKQKRLCRVSLAGLLYSV